MAYLPQINLAGLLGQGSMTPGSSQVQALLERIRQRGRAPAGAGPQPVAGLPSQSLPGASPAPFMPHLASPQGAQATLNPPDYQSLTNREIFGGGLSQALAASSQRPVRSLAEAIGNLGSAFLAAPGLALEQKQGEFYQREDDRTKTEERRREDERQALEDARKEKQFAVWFAEHQAAKERRDKEAEQAEILAGEEAQGRASREVDAAESRKLVGDDIEAKGMIDAWVKSGKPEHLALAQKAISRVTQGGGKMTSERIPGTNSLSVQLPDGRSTVVELEKDDDPNEEPQTYSVPNLPGVHIVSQGKKTWLVREDKNGGAPKQTKIPDSEWRKALEEAKFEATTEAVAIREKAYAARGGTDYATKAQVPGWDPELEKTISALASQKMDRWMENRAKSDELKRQKEEELRRRRVSASGYGGLAPPQQGGASIGSMTAQTDTMALSGTAEKLKSLPPEQALRRLVAGSDKDRAEQDFEKLKKRLAELRMLGVSDHDAMTTIVREYSRGFVEVR